MIRQQHNKTAVQSQHMIADALMALLRRKPYTTITVSQLCREAAIGRKTFYRNFDTREDVIDLILSDMLEVYRRRLQEIPSDERLSFYFTFIKENAEFFTALYHNGLIETANRKFSVLIAETMPVWSCDPIEQEYRSRFVCAGVVAIAEAWMQFDCRDSIDQLVGFIRNAIGYR
ncbi:MAG: TetR family transcriptional regulator C-terminal domain-containing protein [Clostridiales bacterium]|nr:TetR family transcriptional regulator C-terminal domain-containing protein [Clostridiales bacterium]